MSGDLKEMRAYARGYHDGQRSMDADHAAVVLKLSRLRFDGGSHENLHKIAYAVYPCATGWTCESSKGLRDRLIDLLGGVHEHHCDSGRGCACGNRDSGDSGEHAEAMTYDVLGNERHKAVCRLRGISVDALRKKYDYVYACTEFIWSIARAIGLRHGSTYEEIIKRLIYLIGGDHPTSGTVWEAWGREWQDRVSKSNAESDDQPTPSELYGILQDGAESESKGAESVSEMTKNAENGELDSDGTCHNDSPTSSIIDELLDFIDANWPTEFEDARILRETACSVPSTLLAIASRMERRFAKALISRSSELGCYKLRINQLESERDDLRSKLEEADAAIANWRVRERSFEESERERDELQKRLDEMREQREHWASEATKIYRLFFPHEEYGMPNEPSEMVVHKINELQAKLDVIREALDGNH